MRPLLPFLFVLLFSTFSFAQQLNLIPQPASVQTRPGSFILSQKTVIAVADEENKKAAEFLNGYLQQVYGFQLDVDKQEGNNYIRLATRKFVQAPGKDAYSLNVDKGGVTIEGDTPAGTFYGMQTLLQLLPVPAAQSPTTTTQFAIPYVTIQDAPRFAYRGLHLDVGRHFFPLSFLKKYIDYIALHKMNYFHWHLTEDQGWRIEIKKYPELTTKGAYRNGTIIGRYPGIGNDNIRYGGFYTQDEVRELVQYAADRHITVVPEIEMPGHSSAAIAAYPWLSCFPEKETVIPHHPSEASKNSSGKKVQETWGVFEDIFCAGKDSTFLFLQDVLDEVLALFPSRYIHVGGDEAPKPHWKQCPRCQARIKAEGLKDEHELQSYFIQRMEKYINSKGRTLIGWDEILEGGLAPNAIVMSWRGEAGGIAAAKENHYVIMTPGSHVYLDHSQTQNEDSVTIGGFTTVEKVYSYEPIPKELSAEQGKYVLGAQGNVWTEYMRYPSKVEYMIFPRLSALSEVLWTPKEKKNWSDFERRLQTQFRRYEAWGANYSNAYYDIKTTLAPGNKGIVLKLETKDKGGKLMYGIAGKHFAKNYTAPVVLTEAAQVTGLYYRNGKLMDSINLNIHFNKATGRKITLSEQPSKTYPGNGAFTLVDGIINEKGMARTSEFLGYNGASVTATIDLGKTQTVSQVVVHALSSGGSWVYPPQAVEVLVSADGKSYKPAGSTTEFTPSAQGKGTLTVAFDPVPARFVRVQVKSNAVIPEGKPGAGEKPWMFLDEIEVK